MADPLYDAVGQTECQADTLRWLPFKNASSETIPPHAVMRVTQGQKGNNSRRIVLTCDKPSSSFQRIYAINGHSQVAAGRYGSCVFAFDGPVMVAYESNTPAIGEGWGAKPGSWKLNKNYPVGFTHFGYNNTTKSIGLFHQQPCNQIIGKLTASLSQGSTATLNIWIGAGGSESAGTWASFSGQDWLMKSGATAIASGKKVLLQWINGIWYVSEAECS